MVISIPRLTIDMLDELPDDGNRYELLDGMLLVTPAPSQAHQVVATRLTVMLANALATDGKGRVLAVGAIQRGRHTQLQPDVLVVPATYPPTVHWREMHKWWLAVEVLSPASRLYDREVKRAAYLSFGVEEYWIVDIDNCFVEVFTRNETRRVYDTLLWRPGLLGLDVAINLAELFSDVCTPAPG